MGNLKHIRSYDAFKFICSKVKALVFGDTNVSHGITTPSLHSSGPGVGNSIMPCLISVSYQLRSRHSHLLFFEETDIRIGYVGSVRADFNLDHHAMKNLTMLQISYAPNDYRLTVSFLALIYIIMLPIVINYPSCVEDQD